MSDSVRQEIEAAARAVASLADKVADIERIAGLVTDTLAAGGAVHFAGNGGSAADAQHLAAELAGRYLLDRRPLAASALTTNSSALTAIANDMGYEEVFARQIGAAARPGDVVVLISTSGTSPSIVRAFAAAREAGCRVAVMTGPKGTELADAADAGLVVGAETTPHIQEAHIAAGHIICGMVEASLADG